MNRSYFHRSLVAAICVVGAFVAMACDKGSAQAERESPTQSKTEQADSPQPSATPDADADKRAALASYQRIRASLARDAIAATTADATTLERSARVVATSGVSDATTWKDLADAAKDLRATPKDDADQVRKSFGEVSRHMLAALASDAEAAKGLHVFECPMAQGFKKWVQPAAEISNPYMGTRMPKCGSESSL